VVFVTAYNQYAVEAFRLNALDYLLKPVSAGRLLETLYRIMEEKAVPVPLGGVVVRCFGKFTVSAGMQEIRFRTEKAEELLAYLIDSRGCFVSRSKILDSLWEDFDGDRAIVHFNSTLHNVKKALLPYGIQISILYDRGSYQLDTESIDCDYLKFSAFEEKADMVKAENIQEYEKIAALYTGEYLTGWEFYWASGKRIQLEERFIGLLLEMARYYRDTGNYQKAVKWLKEGLNHSPLSRELNYRLIEALQLANEQMLAVKYFELYKNGLMKKLMLNPDSAFKKLLRRL
jgi:two-component SAPR family response regulator